MNFVKNYFIQDSKYYIQLLHTINEICIFLETINEKVFKGYGMQEPIKFLWSMTKIIKNMNPYGDKEDNCSKILEFNFL